MKVKEAIEILNGFTDEQKEMDLKMEVQPLSRREAIRYLDVTEIENVARCPGAEIFLPELDADYFSVIRHT